MIYVILRLIPKSVCYNCYLGAYWLSYGMTVLLVQFYSSDFRLVDLNLYLYHYHQTAGILPIGSQNYKTAHIKLYKLYELQYASIRIIQSESLSDSLASRFTQKVLIDCTISIFNYKCKNLKVQVIELVEYIFISFP